MKRDLPLRICAYRPCGFKFSPRRRHQKFHTSECRVAHHESIRRQGKVLEELVGVLKRHGIIP